jgi:hypothetical protein
VVYSNESVLEITWRWQSISLSKEASLNRLF